MSKTPSSTNLPKWEHWLLKCMVSLNYSADWSVFQHPSRQAKIGNELFSKLEKEAFYWMYEKTKLTSACVVASSPFNGVCSEADADRCIRDLQILLEIRNFLCKCKPFKSMMGKRNKQKSMALERRQDNQINDYIEPYIRSTAVSKDNRIRSFNIISPCVISNCLHKQRDC